MGYITGIFYGGFRPLINTSVKNSSEARATVRAVKHSFRGRKDMSSLIKLLAPETATLLRKPANGSFLSGQENTDASDAHTCVHREHRVHRDDDDDLCWQRRFEDAQAAFRDRLYSK